MPRRRALRKVKKRISGVRLAITIGDAAGIGPEVLIKSLSKMRSRGGIIVIADERPLNELSKRLSLPIRFENVPMPEACPQRVGTVACFSHDKFPTTFKRGRSQRALSVLAVRSIETAVSLAMRKAVDGIVTSPINKAGLKAAGFHIPGHTEFMAELSGTKHYEMMLIGGPLRVVLVTRHTSIKDVPKNIKSKRVEEAILLTAKELKSAFGIRHPRIVVCGLNPHAGEKGTIGREELQRIAPAVRAAQKKTDATLYGPLSADALFYDAYRGLYDAVICMYHDQGLIPLKMISRGHGVNVTLGLPLVRTSPDHGTAYDITDRFIANPGSMTEAIQLAVTLCRRRKQNAISR